MGLLTQAELLAIQSVAESGMIGTATILTRSTVETPDGQQSVWADNGDVPCWVKEMAGTSATLGAIAGAVGMSEPFSIRVPVGSDVHSGDQLAVGSTLYLVQHANNDDTYPAWLMCACRPAEV